jgi:DNA-binding response OmpR family regulator
MPPKWNILIVDDDVELGNLLARALGGLSDQYDVRVARDVDEAMAQVRRSQTARRAFDLVITDIKMPGLSGLELLEALNSIAPETKTIAMTAYDSPDLSEDVQALNVCAYLTKPFVVSEFRNTVCDALSQIDTPAGSPEREPDPELTTAQRALISEQLAATRALTGGTAALFLRLDGTVTALDALEPAIEVQYLCAALVDAQRAVAQQMSRVLGQDSPVRQSYFGTDSHSICTYRLRQPYLIAVVFGPGVKEGQVWYYVREAAEKLEVALATPAGSLSTRRQALKGDLFKMLDQFFPDRRASPRARRPSGSVEAPPELAVDAQHSSAALTTGLPDPDKTDEDRGQDTPTESPKQASVEASLEVAPTEPDSGDSAAVEDVEPVDLSIVDDIDWDLPDNTDWDTLPTDAEQDFEGIDFEEARRRGLIDSLPGG